jgi:hypothetical protein
MTLILEVRFKSTEGKDIFQEFTITNPDSYSLGEVTLKKVEEKTIILDMLKGK